MGENLHRLVGISNAHYYAKFGHQIRPDDVLSDGERFYRANFIAGGKTLELFSCKHGYLHEPTDEQLRELKIVGNFFDLAPLLVCD